METVVSYFKMVFRAKTNRTAVSSKRPEVFGRFFSELGIVHPLLLTCLKPILTITQWWCHRGTWCPCKASGNSPDTHTVKSVMLLLWLFFFFWKEFFGWFIIFTVVSAEKYMFINWDRKKLFRNVLSFTFVHIYDILLLKTSSCSLPHLKCCRDASIVFVFAQAGQMVENKGGQERDLHHSSQKKTS